MRPRAQATAAKQGKGSLFSGRQVVFALERGPLLRHYPWKNVVFLEALLIFDWQ